MDVIPNSSGKRILAGGWWGRLRHPDDLGDILMALGLTIPAGTASLVPWIMPLMLVLTKVLRFPRVEKLCAQKYGAAAWAKYVHVVPYRLVPRVY